jgi:hypothetical protein
VVASVGLGVVGRIGTITGFLQRLPNDHMRHKRTVRRRKGLKRKAPVEKSHNEASKRQNIINFPPIFRCE